MSRIVSSNQIRSKWVEQVHADDTVAEAARVTLQLRLAAVAHYLHLAAKHPDKTPENVHQLRVYTRRSIAALSMYEEVLPEKKAKWFRKRLRQLRRAGGDARDLDVFLLRYQKKQDDIHSEFLRELRRRRKKAQGPIVELYSKFIPSHRFEKHVQRLLTSIPCKPEFCDQPLGPWARSRLDQAINRFYEASPKKSDNLKALHRFRVRGKELRYAMELLSTVFPPDFRTSLYPRVTQLQDKLGELNDHATAGQHFARWSDETDSRRLEKYLRKLISRESEELDKSIARFRKWWTPEYAENLEASLRAMTNGRRPEPTP